METQITVRRPDGTTEIVTKPGHITDSTLRRKMTEATRSAGKGEIVCWQLIGKRPVLTGPSYKEVLYGRRDGSDRKCHGCGRPGCDGECGLGNVRR